MGERAYGTQVAGRHEQITLFGALSLKGFLAPMTIEGATNTDIVAAYMEHVLIAALEPGQIVVLDNPSSHKAESIERLVQAAGCQLLFLPPYSPDLRPDRGGMDQDQGGAAKRQGAKPGGHRGRVRRHHRPNHDNRCTRLVLAPRGLCYNSKLIRQPL